MWLKQDINIIEFWVYTKNIIYNVLEKQALFINWWTMVPCWKLGITNCVYVTVRYRSDVNEINKWHNLPNYSELIEKIQTSQLKPSTFRVWIMHCSQ